MNKNYIAVIHIPAIATVSGWVRTAKTVYISAKTPPLWVSAITDAIKVQP